MKTLVLIVILLSGVVLAQDPKMDFKTINKTYAEATKLSMQLKYELFFDSDTKPSDVEYGVYKRDQNNFYVKQTDREMLITGQHILVIDNETKTLIVDKAKENINPINPLQVDLDSIFTLYQKVEFYKTGSNNGLHAYRFTLKNGPYTAIDVVFNPSTYFVVEITNTYREKMNDANNIARKASLKTSFTNVNSKPVFTSDFNETKYIVNKNNSIALAASYAKYKLLTNLKK